VFSVKDMEIRKASGCTQAPDPIKDKEKKR
jgi:hypothetical protein